MPQRAATIESLPMAFEVVKAMQALEWNEDYRPFARQALAEVVKEQMALAAFLPSRPARRRGRA